MKNRHNFEGRVWENRGNWTPNSWAPRLPSTGPNPHAGSYIFGPFSPPNYEPKSQVSSGKKMSCEVRRCHVGQLSSCIRRRSLKPAPACAAFFFWKPFPNILGVFFVLFLLYQGLVAVVCCPNSPAAPFVRHLLCCHRRLQTSKVRRQGFRLRVSKPPWRLLGYGLWRHFLSKSSETRGCVTGRRKPRFQGSLY